MEPRAFIMRRISMTWGKKPNENISLRAFGSPHLLEIIIANILNKHIKTSQKYKLDKVVSRSKPE